MKYLLVDPTTTRLSGISTYTRLAQRLLQDNGLQVHAMTRQMEETEDNFNRRVVRAAPEYDWLEVPESCSAVQGLVGASRFHLRLQGSRFLGALVERGTGDEDDRLGEMLNVQRADIISTPSRAGLRLANRVYPVPASSIYPNPAPRATPGASGGPRDLDVLFLGRFQELKGTAFLPRIVSGLPAHFRILLAGRGCCEWVLAHGLERAVMVMESPQGESRMELYRRAKVVIVPSLYETFSYVACEALACGAHVVTWDGFGLQEWISRGSLRTARPWDVADFVAQILGATDAAPTPVDPDLLAVNQAFVAGTLAITSGRPPLIGFDRPYVLPTADHDTVYRTWKQRLAGDAALKGDAAQRRAHLRTWSPVPPT